MKRRTELHPHEHLMLLALRDDKGTLESKASMHSFALGGALLAELGIHGRIAIDDTKKAMVDVVDRRPLGEPVLDDCLERVAIAKRRARASTWVQRFANLKRLRHRVAAGLCRQGILRDDEDTVLLVFTRKVYPTIDPRPERELLGRLRDAVFGDAPSIAPDVALVVTVANAAGLLAAHFDKASLKRRKHRLEAIADGHLVGAATKQAVQAAQQAAMAAISAATTAAVVSSATSG